MAEGYKHLTYGGRCVIEDGIRDGLSAREIAARLGMAPTTVTREVQSNRTVRPPKRKDMTASKRCANYAGCDRYGLLCDPCVSQGQHACRRCRAVKCFDVCPDFELRMCERTERWPYVCTCHELERSSCMLPKCSYRAREADEASRARRARAGRGVALSDAELEALTARVAPLVANGLSLEAIWAEDPGSFPVTWRTYYSYIDRGLVDVAAIQLPRKVRMRGRAGKGGGGADPLPARALAGRTHADFLALDGEARAGAVQVDTVLGRKEDSQRILSLHMAALSFQLYVLLPSGESASVVAALDAIERYCGSRAAFAGAFGVLLADRGCEFSDAEGIERSALEPGARRCRLYYCDPMSPGQKGSCERNHEELRRILPKRRSTFDALSFSDVAAICSHVNSYPRRRLGGRSPIELAALVLPDGLLESLGVAPVPLDEVVLRPRLVAHAVEL